MKKLLTTHSGSQYLIDFEAKTWERLVEGGDKSTMPLRSRSGTFHKAFPPVVGERFNMLCPPYSSAGAQFRYITTSPVTKVEDYEEESPRVD